MKNFKKSAFNFLALIGSALLVACSSGDNSGSGSSRGSLQITPAAISLTQGSTNTPVMISLVGSSGVSNQLVTVRSNEEGVATVSPTTCTLSSGDLNKSTCTVFVTGVSTGTFSLTASSPGYQNATASGTVITQGQKGWGSISVNGAVNYTDTIAYQISAGGAIKIQATLVNSQNITTADAVYAKVNSVAGLTFPNGQSCQLTSANSSCFIAAQVTTPSTSTITTTVTADPAQASAAHYPSSANTTTVNIVGGSTPTPSSALGSIVVSAVSNSATQNTFYTGANGPLVATWTNQPASGTDQYEITLTSSNASLQFYAYSGLTKYTSQVSFTTSGNVQQNCTMSLAGSGNTSCGFNVAGISNGSTNISCQVQNLSNPGGPVPLCSTQAFNVVAQPSTGRTLTFVNNLQNTAVVLGATSGTVASYTGADNGGTNANSATPTHTTQTPSAAGSSCGSNSSNNPAAQTACPFGSTCKQGGANPVSTDVFYCYADTPAGTNNQANAIPPNGGQLQVTIPSFWGSQAIQWSGNFYFMGQDCLNANTGGNNACQVQTNAGPQVAAVTLAEVTFQNNANDYYDISIINGLNYAVKFKPDSQTAAQYSCGTPGGGSADNTSDLGVSTWSFTPPSNIYNLVLPSGTISSAPSVQGYYLNCALQGASCTWNPTDSTAFTTGSATGKFYGYSTGDQIYGWGGSGSYYANQAPFYFQQAVGNGTPSSLVNGNLFLCNNGTYTDYIGQTTQSEYLACGGVNWGGNSAYNPPFSSTWGGSPSQLTTPTNPVTKVNPVWVQYVLPTIAWLKAACPTCYTFPYDDKSSTFQCSNATGGGMNTQSYTISVSDVNGGNR